MPALRSTLKAAAEAALLHGGPAGLARRRLGAGRLILAYHDVAPDGAAATGDRSLHLPRAAFARQLDRLQAGCDVVPLDRLLDEPAADRPRVAITFDDAYRGAVTLGVAELAARGLPATIFVAPAFVGDGTFWWDALAAEGGLDETTRAHALDALAGRDAEVRGWAAARGTSAHAVPAHMRVAGEDELRAALEAHAGLALGSHTWSHPNLARLAEVDPGALAGELERPRAWLRERFTGRFAARTVDWIAYLYGLASRAVADAARAAGYRGGCLVRGGWIRGTVDPLLLPRFNVPAGITDAGFALRLAGLLRA